jgi:PPOX class probable F420-dependent enzyme
VKLVDRMAAVQNRFYDRIRHRDAARVADGPATAPDFSMLAGHKYCLVTTYRRNGQGISTPVWFGVQDGRLYFRTWADSVKVRRIRNDPRARVTPCSTRGKPKGSTAEGRARILDASENEGAERAIQSNYGLGRRLYEAPIDAANASLVYVEVVPGGTS